MRPPPPPAVWQADGIWLSGAPRVAFSFPLGVLLHRLWQSGDLPHIRLPALGIVVLFVALLFVATLGDPRIASLCTIVIGWPLVLVLGVSNEPGRMTRRLFQFLADISYPLYATHIGFYMIAGASVAMVAHDLAFAVAGIAAFAFAIAADRLYDRPVRRWLTQVTAERFGRGRAAPG